MFGARKLSLSLALLLTLSAAGFGQDDDAEERAAAREDGMMLVNEAIRAIGGRKAIEAHNAATWSETGTYHGMGQALPYTGEYAVQWPDKFKMEIQGVFTTIIKGDKGWIKTPEETREMTEQEFKQQEINHYEGNVTRLLLLRDKAYDVAVLDDAQVNGRPCLIVLVKHQGRADVKLYFDQKTSLLVKSETTVQAPEQDFKEVKRETLFLEYREMDGIKMATRLVMNQDGKPFIEATISDYKSHKALDDSVFAVD